MECEEREVTNIIKNEVLKIQKKKIMNNGFWNYLISFKTGKKKREYLKIIVRGRVLMRECWSARAIEELLRLVFQDLCMARS